MCIAIVTLPGRHVDNAALYRGWTCNKDGAGFAYVKDGKVHIEKGLMTYNELQTKYEKAVEAFGDKSAFLLHMRVGTSGSVSKTNTHPFPIRPQEGPGGAFIHNGILFTPAGAWKGPVGDQKSDTRVVSEALNNILRLQDVMDGRELIGKAIGGGNKLAFLYDTGDYVIVNEKSGFWNEGIWYSNGTCKINGTR
jgi:glutamine phosphoribosylpyrophosphate amidotransferase